MKEYVKATKEFSNGIFWYIDDEKELLSYPFGSVASVNGIAKSGNTYNQSQSINFHIHIQTEIGWISPSKLNWVNLKEKLSV